MAKETFWFKHDYNARDDIKSKALIKRYGLAGYGMYWYLAEMMHDQHDGKIKYDDGCIALLSDGMNVKPDILKKMVNYCISIGLFINDDGFIYSERANRNKEIKNLRSQAGKLGAATKWGEAAAVRKQRLKDARLKGTHTDEEWQEMLDFFNVTCLSCGVQESIVKDHIKPIYQGGSDSITNLQPLCRSCNSRKGPDSEDLRLDYCKEKGWQMPSKWVANGWQMGGREDNIREDKKVLINLEGEGEKNSPPAPSKEELLKIRQEKFYQMLVPHVQEYGKEMIRAFFNYWSEPNKSRTKMKWENENTWDLKLRLDRWRDKDDKWQSRQPQPNNTASVANRKL